MKQTMYCLQYYLGKMIHSHVRAKFPDILKTRAAFKSLSDYQYSLVVKSETFNLPLLITLFPSLKMRCLITLAASYRRSFLPVSLEQFSASYSGIAARSPPVTLKQLHALVAGKAGLQDAHSCTIKKVRAGLYGVGSAKTDFLLRTSFYPPP